MHQLPTFGAAQTGPQGGGLAFFQPRLCYAAEMIAPLNHFLDVVVDMLPLTLVLTLVVISKTDD